MKKELESGMEILNDTRDKLSNDIVAAGDRLKHFSGKLESARQALSHGQSAVADGARKFAGGTGQYVHAYPWQAMGVAAAAGVVLGWLLARR